MNHFGLPGFYKLSTGFGYSLDDIEYCYSALSAPGKHMQLSTGVAYQSTILAGGALDIRQQLDKKHYLWSDLTGTAFGELRSSKSCPITFWSPRQDIKASKVTWLLLVV